MKKFLTVSAVVLALLSATAWASVTMRDLIITASTFTNGAITSSTINSTSVGATTPSTGAFTSLQASGGLNNTAVGNVAPSTGIFTSVVATTLTGTGLTSGDCLQASTSGLLATTSTPCSFPFTGTSGFQKLPSGLILEWAQVGSVPIGSGADFTLPFTFPNGCFGVNATDNGGAAIGSNPRTIGSGCVSNSQIWLVASGTPSGNTFYMAIGY